MSFSFSLLFSFLAILQVLQYAFLILHVFQFSHHIPGPTACISHFPRFPVFLPYSRSYSVCFSFSTIFCFLAILQVLPCEFLIFLIFILLAILQVLQYAYLILHVFEFSHHIPGSTLCISHFSTFFVFSRHISSPKVCI